MQGGEVFGVVREAFDDLAILNIGEGVVDAGELADVDLVRRERAVPREDVRDDVLLLSVCEDWHNGKNEEDSG